MLWTALFQLFPSLISGAIQAYNKSVDASVQKYKVDGTVDIAALSAQVSLAQAQRDILVAEQGHFLTRLPRPLFGISAAAWVFKVLVWDNVLGYWTHGYTAPVTGYTATVLGIIVGGYFLHETVKTIRG